MPTAADQIQQRSIAALRPKPQNAPPGAYIPTLIVGLGGTGVRTLRYLKQYLKDQKENNIELLAIDCDLSETDKYPELPPLIHREELVFLEAEPADAAIVGAADSNNTYLLDYLPDTQGSHGNIHTEVRNTMRRQRGAGQRRRVGRVFFEANCEDGAGLIDVIKKKKEKLRGMNTRSDFTQRGYIFQPHASVYVVSSLAGGTGAGSLLSALALMRNIFSRPGDTITLVGVLPGEKLDAKLTDRFIEVPATRANAIALLKELQATRITNFPTYTFDLSDLHKQQARNTTLADSVYLLDHELFDGTPVPDYEDICHTGALFLYSFVGTGVGTADACGEVNLTTSSAAKGDGIPRCFDSIGLSVLTYPMEDLMEYCGRHAFGIWADRWLTPQKDAGLAKQSAKDVGMLLGLMNAETFIERFKGAIGMTSVGFLHDEHERKEAIATDSDTALKTRVAIAQNDFETKLNSAEAALNESVDNITTAFCGTLRAEALKFLNGPATQAKENIKALLVMSKACKDDLTRSLENNEAEISKLESKIIPSKERWLSLPGNTLGNRDKYLSVINEWFELKLRRVVGPRLMEAIGRIIHEISAFSTELSQVTSDIQSIANENLKAISNFDKNKESSSGLVLYAMQRCEFKKFVADVAPAELASLELQSLDCEAIIDAVILKSCDGYEAKINAIHLPTEIARRASADSGMDPLLNAVKAANDASQPRIRFKNNLPRPHELSPRKYVVGNEIPDETTVLFPPRSANANVTAVTKFADRYRMIVVETFHNFGAAHWQGFEVAKVYYDEDSWWRHVLPEKEINKLPGFINAARAHQLQPATEPETP